MDDDRPYFENEWDITLQRCPDARKNCNLASTGRCSVWFGFVYGCAHKFDPVGMMKWKSNSTTLPRHDARSLHERCDLICPDLPKMEPAQFNLAATPRATARRSPEARPGLHKQRARG